MDVAYPDRDLVAVCLRYVMAFLDGYFDWYLHWDILTHLLGVLVALLVVAVAMALLGVDHLTLLLVLMLVLQTHQEQASFMSHS